jgi:Flp pilus assembly protein CpaB
MLAAALTAVAVVTGIAAARPAPPPTTEVVVAANDLSGGSVLTATDVKITRLPVEVVPAVPMAALSAVEGRVLAGPMRAGEVVTDLRLVGPALLEGYTSTAGVTVVATPVRIADAGAVRLVRPGDRIDVLAAGVPSELAAAGITAAEVAVVASDVQVVTVPEESDDLAVVDGALIVVATSEQVAEDLAAAAVTSRLSLTLRPD